MPYRKHYAREAFVRAYNRQAAAVMSEQSAALAARAAKRAELQPQYDAVTAWRKEQVELHGFSADLDAEVDRRNAELDAQVAAAAPM